ncbi:nucleoside-diphosphate kinase [Paenibacillus koleovorans]|uniref:nucleoside-diphosphate kinase n=1 Tax=Paenibacillus koleovorans TaxID=121608 RepID=UPI000FD80CF7|nr:nucleoside-diphosphate kinase [Paenibacillus koleovorans]
MERTFMMVKPDGVERGLIGEIVQRLERRGFQLVGCKLMQIPKEMAEKHYAEHAGRPYYDDLMNFITAGPVFAMVWEGDQVIALSRIMMGKTNTLEALPGTIRGDFAIHTNRNIIHGSDSPENALREIAIFFQPHELLCYSKAVQKWI